MHTRRITTVATYKMAINGTTIWETLEILLIPPIMTRPTQTVRRMPLITIVQEYDLPKSVTLQDLEGSKKLLIALVIPFTWVNVPIPRRPTPTPKKAKILASHFQFLPIPF